MQHDPQLCWACQRGLVVGRTDGRLREIIKSMFIAPVPETELPILNGMSIHIRTLKNTIKRLYATEKKTLSDLKLDKAPVYSFLFKLSRLAVVGDNTETKKWWITSSLNHPKQDNVRWEKIWKNGILAIEDLKYEEVMNIVSHLRRQLSKYKKL